MAYLDDELAAEERRELEVHLMECASCRQHVEGERADLEMMRRALAPPPAPEVMKERIARALDDEDRRVVRAERKAWSRWILPGTAVTAAAAALFVFLGVGLKPPQTRPIAATVAYEVVRQQTRPLPLEVQGASTGSWLREHFAPVEPPQFTEPGIQLIGARATAIQGHDAALLRYIVTVGLNRMSLTAVLIANVNNELLSGGQPIQVGKLTLSLHDADGQPAVTYIDENRIGYVFTSERMTVKELLSIVVTSDLIGRAQQQLR
jgi:anti-sigma factor RsiW